MGGADGGPGLEERMSTCVCGHSYAAHQEIVTSRGFSSGECTGGGNELDNHCTCSYYEHDHQGDQ